MKVYFVKPGDREWISYPIQYAVLSAYLKNRGHQVSFHDSSLDAESPEEALKKTDLSGFDALGISIYSASQNWAKAFISLVKGKYPEIKVIVGGPHISSLEVFAVEHLGADIGVVGEGELPLAALLDRIKNNKAYDDVPGLIWRSGGGFLNTLSLPRQRVKELDTLPMPDYEMIRPDAYFSVFRSASVARRHERCASIFTSRGCPYMCSYCATNCTWLRRITAFSADRVVQEITLLREKYGVREVWFSDDTFTFSRERTMNICRQLVEKKLGVSWRLPNGIRLESVDDELASWMSRAGCYETGVGVETGSESAMKRINKRLDLKIVREKLKILRKNRILVSGFFIFGFPWETPEQVRETERFILENPFDRVGIFIFSPYPGSEEFDNIMNKKDPAAYEANVRKYLYDGKMDPFLAHLNLDMLYKKTKEVYFRFYTKPRVLWSVLTGISLVQIKDILRHPRVKNFFRKKNETGDTYVKLEQ